MQSGVLTVYAALHDIFFKTKYGFEMWDNWRRKERGIGGRELLRGYYLVFETKFGWCSFIVFSSPPMTFDIVV